jgi:hypothetical protein
MTRVTVFWWSIHSTDDLIMNEFYDFCARHFFPRESDVYYQFISDVNFIFHYYHDIISTSTPGIEGVRLLHVVCPA